MADDLNRPIVVCHDCGIVQELQSEYWDCATPGCWNMVVWPLWPTERETPREPYEELLGQPLGDSALYLGLPGQERRLLWCSVCHRLIRHAKTVWAGRSKQREYVNHSRSCPRRGWPPDSPHDLTYIKMKEAQEELEKKEMCTHCDPVRISGWAFTTDEKYFGGMVDDRRGMRFDPLMHEESCPTLGHQQGPQR
jgi:hypothetical protein